MDKKTKHNRLLFVIHTVKFSKMHTHLCAHEQRFYYRPSSHVFSPLFHFALSYSRDIVDVNVNDGSGGDDDDDDEQPAHRGETMKMQANPP